MPRQKLQKEVSEFQELAAQALGLFNRYAKESLLPRLEKFVKQETKK